MTQEVIPLNGKIRIRAWQKNPLFPDDRDKDILIKDKVIKNLIVNVGKDSILKALGGSGLTGGGTADKIGVGDNTDPAALTDTDLVAATNKLWKQISTADKTYVRPTVFLSVSFGFAEANWTWNEIGLGDSNGDPPTGNLWARQIDGTPLVKDNTKRAIVEWQLSL